MQGELGDCLTSNPVVDRRSSGPLGLAHQATSVTPQRRVVEGRGERIQPTTRSTDMAKKPTHHREEWTPPQVAKLKNLAAGNTPTGLIAHWLGRTEGAVNAKAQEQHISLQPWNQSPYGPRRNQ